MSTYVMREDGERERIPSNVEKRREAQRLFPEKPAPRRRGKKKDPEPDAAEVETTNEEAD